jgi:dipeptidase E
MVLDEFVKFVGRNPEDVSVGFITTPADTYEDKWFVEKDINEFLGTGFKVKTLDIKNMNEQDIYDMLKNFDVIGVSGGSVFYMMEKSIDTGFFNALERLLSEGKIYVGGSAGAILVGPSLEPVTALDRPELAPGLKSYNGPGFVDFVVIPHFGEEKYKDRMAKILEDYKDFKYKLLPLTNKQAVEVVGNKFKIVQSSS